MARLPGNSLAAGLVLIVALAVLTTAGSAGVVTWILGDRSAQASTSSELQGSHAVLRLLQQQRYQQLRYISRLFSTDQLLTSYMAEAAQARDPSSVFDILEEYQNLLNFEVAVVLDSNGLVLARTDAPEDTGEDLSGNPLVAVALAEREAFGVWQQGDRLYHAVAVPLLRQFDLVGYTIVAFSINDALALQVQRASGADTLFLVNSSTGPSVTASTFNASQGEELISQLRRQGELFQRVTRKGETVDQVEIDLGGESMMVFLAPLHDAARKAVGASVSLTSLDQPRSYFHQILLVLAVVGLVAAFASALLALALTRRSSRPARLLASAVGEVAQGNLETQMPKGLGGDLGRMAESLGDIVVGMREKLALEYFVGRVIRFLPEPAKVGGAVRPEARKVALLGVEMRRFANAKIGYDPEENLSRFARDLQRISAAVVSHKGRVEAVYGHRVLAVFDQEASAFQAMSAATEVLLVLSERESVFDEPEPPVIALSCGGVVTGSVVWGDRPGTALAGPPVQQLESVLREAPQGDIYFTKALYTELGPYIQRAAVQVKAQRGILSPQPLLVITAEQGCQLTGVSAGQVGSGVQEGRSFTDIAPGTLLGNRFDVLAEIGAGRTGLVVKARDRELGDLVTLKMLRPEVVADADRFDRLRSVIRIARGIRSPNVLGVLDFGEADGMPYISCEFVRAMTLRQTLDHSRQVPLVAGVRIARQICFALLAAHQERLLHRGLKPQNVLVEANGGVKVMDFGLSGPVGAGGVVEGVEYLAPEQLEGREADPRADIYAFGVVLYEMFTGQVPYTAGTLEEMRQKLATEQPAPPSSQSAEIPAALEEIILRAMARAPEQRFETVDQLLESFEALR